MSENTETLTREFYLHDYYLARHRGYLTAACEKYGEDSEEAEKWRKLVAATRERMIEIGSKIGRMRRAH